MPESGRQDWGSNDVDISKVVMFQHNQITSTEEGENQTSTGKVEDDPESYLLDPNQASAVIATSAWSRRPVG